MKQIAVRIIGVVLIVFGGLVFLNRVAQAGGWSASPANSELNIDSFPSTCRSQITFGFASDLEDLPITFLFYRGDNGDNGDLIGTHEFDSRSDFPLTGDASQSYCSDFQGDEPKYCGGPVDMDWNTTLNSNEDISLVIEDNNGNNLWGSPDQFELINCSDLNIDLIQVGPGSNSTSSPITDKLVFQVEASNPEVGTADGDGIDYVDMQILDSNENVGRQKDESGVKYCVFGGGDPDCNEWDFSDNGFEWPNGSDIRNGDNTLRAIAYAEGGGSKQVDYPIQIELPISGSWEQIGENSTSTTVMTNLVGEVDAYLGSSSNDDDVDRVDIMLYGPDNQLIFTEDEGSPPFCLFGGGDPCPVYNFAANGNEWPNGDPIEEGTHRLEAFVFADDPGPNRSLTLSSFTFEIEFATPTPTFTPTNTPTNTPTATNTLTSTSTPTPGSTSESPTPSNTPTPASTSVSATPTNTPTSSSPTPTSTPSSSASSTPSSTPSGPTPTSTPDGTPSGTNFTDFIYLPAIFEE